jgi:large subunit ribosomal protein L21
LDKVLLVGSKTETMLGHPYLEGAIVHSTVEEITEADKVMIFKKRRRKNSKRLRGFRRDVVTLRINKISFAHDLLIQSSRLSTTGPKVAGSSEDA